MVMPGRPRVSVVVPTLNRAGSLGQTVQSLMAQRVDAPYEVIVVDNGSTDATVQTVQRLAAGGDVRYVFEPRRGLSVARNRGIAEACGDIFAFLDDDAVARPTWLASLIDAYRRHPDAWCVGGKIVLRLPDDRPAWFDPRSPLLNAYLSGLDRGEDVVELRYPDDVWGSNFSVRRDVLERVGGFDPSVGVAGPAHLAGEESELCWRIQRAGGGVYYCGRAVVEHIVPAQRLTKRWFRMRARRQGQTDVMVRADGPSPVWPAMRCAAVMAAKSAVRAWIDPARVDHCRVFEDELSFWRALGRGWQRLVSRGSTVSTHTRPAGGVGGD
jgi:glycosyltransferase involved in cell wall biosynthesis